MKNLVKSLLLVAAIAFVSPVSSFAGNTEQPVTVSTERGSNQELNRRIAELNSMDMSKMTSKEKRAIRHELRAMKRSANTSGGIYLSAGAVILIVILLIILL